MTADNPQPNPRVLTHPLAAPIASALLAVVLFYPVAGHDYVYDGAIIIGQDARLDDPSFALRVWVAPWWPQGARVPISRPLVQFTYWVQTQLHGRDFEPGGFNAFHFVDLLLFAALCAGVAHLTRRFVGLTWPPTGRMEGGSRQSHRTTSKRRADREHPSPSPSPSGRGAATASWLVGLAFAAHPLHAEVVASTVGRADTLALGFTVLGLLAFLRWRNSMTWRRAALLGVCVLAGGLSKETGYLLAPMLGLVELGLRRARITCPPTGGTEGGPDQPASTVQRTDGTASSDALLSQPLPGGEGGGSPPAHLWRFAVVVGVVVVVAIGQRQAMQHLAETKASRPVAMDNPLAESKSVAERAITPLKIIGRAAKLSAWPIRSDPSGELPLLPANSPDYSPRMLMPTATLADAEAAAGLVIAIAWLALTVWAWRRRRAVAAVLLCWPVAWFIPSNTLVIIGTIFGERLAMPMTLLVPLTLAMLVPWRALGRPGRGLLCAAAGVWIALVAAATFIYVPAFNGNDQLQAYTVSRHPTSGRFQGFFALSAFRRARVAGGPHRAALMAAAERHANLALEYWPRNAGPYAVLGGIEAERGNTAEAREYLEYASRGTMRRDFADFFLEVLGEVEARGTLLARIDELKPRVEADPNDVATWRTLASLYRQTKQWKQAAEAFAHAIPDDAALAAETDLDLLDEYLAVLLTNSRPDDAVKVYRRLIALQPDQWSHYADAAIVALTAPNPQRYHEQAAAWLDRAMKLSPGSPEPWAGVSELLYQQGRIDQAIGAIGEALRRAGPDDFKRRLYREALAKLEKKRR